MESSSPSAESSARPVPRWLAWLSFAGLLIVLLAGLEVAARMLTSSADNPGLRRIVRDYGQLARRGPDWIRFVPDSELSYRLRPGFELISERDGGTTRHNADGFRNNHDFAEKASGILRIACYGASTTYGVGVGDNRDTYPARLEALLNGTAKPAGWTKVEVWNLGVGGYTSRKILGTLERTLPVLQPDVVLIQNAINDVIPRFYPEYRPDYSHFRTDFTPLQVSFYHQIAYRSHAWLALAYGMGWIKPLSLQSQTQRPMPPVERALENLEKTPPVAFEKNLERAVTLAREAGCQVWLLTQAYLDVPDFAGPNEASRRLESGYRKGLQEHTSLVVALAAEADVGVIRIDETMPRRRSCFTDPIHMSAEGNRVKAKLVAEAIGSALPRPPR